MTRALPGGRVAWQRQRAWIEVFSSAEMTYSPTPSSAPSKLPSYRSSARAALAAKSGSRGKIQERCCHGFIAPAASPAPPRRGRTRRQQAAGDDLGAQLGQAPAADRHTAGGGQLTRDR